MTIKDWPVRERPREKLLREGCSVLSDAELLAIFLRTGCSGKTAVDLARDLLNEFGSLRGVVGASKSRFCLAHGMGEAKYVLLQASLEIGRRHLAETIEAGEVFNSSRSVKEYVRSQLRHRTQEVFAALFVDSQNRLIDYKELFFGTIDGASVYPREVVKVSLSINAAAIIFVHNHPSGVAEPSFQDRALTTRLQEALKLIDVRVLDHLVVGEGEVVSFAERGIL